MRLAAGKIHHPENRCVVAFGIDLQQIGIEHASLVEQLHQWHAGDGFRADIRLGDLVAKQVIAFKGCNAADPGRIALDCTGVDSANSGTDPAVSWIALLMGTMLG